MANPHHIRRYDFLGWLPSLMKSAPGWTRTNNAEWPRFYRPLGYQLPDRGKNNKLRNGVRVELTYDGSLITANDLTLLVMIASIALPANGVISADKCSCPDVVRCADQHNFSLL